MKFLLICFVFAHIRVQCQRNRPHIIVILADDMGFNDVSFRGSNQIPTPNIDALAYNGVILDKHYTMHICTPSRAALLTGNYPIRSGMQGRPLNPGEERALPTSMFTMPQKLKELGYKTHLIGKWHLGAGLRIDTPTYKGFDSHIGYWNGYIDYFNYTITVFDKFSNKSMSGYDMHDGLKAAWSYKGAYATNLFTDKAKEIIENHNSKEPLFLVLSHLVPHAPKEGAPVQIPDEKQMNETFGHIPDIRRRKYAESIRLLDESVGEIIEKLSLKGMLGNSIVLFTSDNGGETMGMYKNEASNWPLRGVKFTLFEGGIRSVAALYSPLLNRSDHIHKGFIHITDWLPTFYAAAGGNVENLGNIDGVNQWQSLNNNLPTPRHDALINIDDRLKFSGIISNFGQYKLLNRSAAPNFQYTSYYGENGRENKNFLYNSNVVLQCKTNRAIRRLLKVSPLTKRKITEIRSNATMDDCRKNSTITEDCLSGFCLFDLFKDPCETTNLINKTEYKEIADQLKDKLKTYWPQVKPQLELFMDFNADPVKYNGTWCTWLDDEVCPKTAAA